MVLPSDIAIQSRSPAAARRARQATAVAAVLLFAVSCGHPASREECQEIFDRSAAIELEGQKVTDPETVKERTAEARRDKGAELLRQCEGRRITDRAMKCVRQAQTVKELDGCLM